MQKAMDETQRRRQKQLAYNLANGITPRTIVKQVRDLIDGVYSEKAGKEADKLAHTAMQQVHVAQMTAQEVSREIKRLEKQMHEHALNLAFEQAAEARDQLALLKKQAFGASGADQYRA